MLESSTNGAGAAVEAAAGHEDQRGVAELGVAAGARAGGPGVPAPGEVPDPELAEQAKRRTFTAEYKARILAERRRARGRARSASCSGARGCTRRI